MATSGWAGGSQPSDGSVTTAPWIAPLAGKATGGIYGPMASFPAVVADRALRTPEVILLREQWRTDRTWDRQVGRFLERNVSG